MCGPTWDRPKANNIDVLPCFGRLYALLPGAPLRVLEKSKWLTSPAVSNRGRTAAHASQGHSDVDVPDTGKTLPEDAWWTRIGTFIPGATTYTQSLSLSLKHGFLLGLDSPLA